MLQITLLPLDKRIGRYIRGKLPSNYSSYGQDVIFSGGHYQKKGTGRGLFDYFEGYCKKIGAHTIQTMVQWNDLNLVGFFSALGFNCSSCRSLEKNI